ncbi:hypothetical protein Hanom_Chr16g01458961 [Helianthus anomalus]
MDCTHIPLMVAICLLLGSWSSTVDAAEYRTPESIEVNAIMAPCLGIFNVTSNIDDIHIQLNIGRCCKELQKIPPWINTRTNGLSNLCNILKELVKSLPYFQPKPFGRVMSEKCPVKLGLPLLTPNVNCQNIK